MAVLPGDNGGTRGGASILVRDFLGLHAMGNNHALFGGRTIGGTILVPGGCHIAIVSTYLLHGVGLAEPNISVLHS
eukprot:4289716-Pyramimonas_sp.AAC.1